MHPPVKLQPARSPQMRRRQRRMVWLLWLLLLLLCGWLLWLWMPAIAPFELVAPVAGMFHTPPPTYTPTPTPPASPTPTATATASATMSVTLTASSTLTDVSPTVTATRLPEMTSTPPPLPTPLPLLVNPTAERLPDAIAPTHRAQPGDYPTAAFTPVPTMVSTATPLTSLTPTAATSPLPPTAVPVIVRAVPILMYHYVRVVDAYIDPPGYRLSVSPDSFAAQLAWLDEAGYTPVRMETAERCLQGSADCPAQPIALTFDDGYADAYTTALPLLQKRGFVATFYIVGDFVGREGYMGWDALRSLRDAGMEIGAHSMSHTDLTTLGLVQAQDEITRSRQQLADRLRVPVTSFCYPYGRFTAATRAQVAAAGYTNAVTTIQGWDYRDLHTLPRVRVEGGFALPEFAQLVQSYTPPPR